ncbi:uncharacterized protein LOC141620283 [Silene latifolia]|uniref:uncharacterized protein LOC141620283 n=1 Tax=Silene latifolia TaxID=37657 RepID=UPI003D76BF13
MPGASRAQTSARTASPAITTDCTPGSSVPVVEASKPKAKQKRAQKQILWEELLNQTRTIFVFKAQGQVYHYLPDLIPMDNIPRYLQLGSIGWHQGLKKVSSPAFEGELSTSSPVSAVSSKEPESLIEAEVANTARRHTRADMRISCREYYAYKFQIRPGNFLLRGGRLFQQYIVDMYVKIENTCLDFLGLNQEAIRADLYQGILDTLSLGENSAYNVGKIIVLPPSFLRGPRDMRRRYLNPIALVQKYGKPDLFITVTCNPNWPEIKSEPAPEEQAQNRPDLVALTQPEKFDKYVTAELPSHDNPYLRSAVLRHMMHVPCGAEFPKCACMQIKDRKKECSKGYPKSFRNFTTNGLGSYPLYRRRDTGETVEVRKAIMDNRSVVPYNPYLLAMFDCHLNVENENKKLWKSRDRGVVIGRVAHASPGEGERYYLRLLLEHVRGPTSFEDLVTVNGTSCASFQEATLRRRILKEDNAAGKCMDKAVQVEMQNALRRLFATILNFGCPNNPTEFWDQYYDALSEDFRQRFPNEPEKIFQSTAAQVEEFLEGMGKSFAHFNLAHLHVTQEPTMQITRDISDAISAPVPLLQLASRKELNVGQRIAYKVIIHHVKTQKPGAFFIDGPGGTGKTFLLVAIPLEKCFEE